MRHNNNQQMPLSVFQAHNWIQNAAAASGNNPFLIGKGDSGFISPACASNNQARIQ